MLVCPMMWCKEKLAHDHTDKKWPMLAQSGLWFSRIWRIFATGKCISSSMPGKSNVTAYESASRVPSFSSIRKLHWKEKSTPKFSLLFSSILKLHWKLEFQVPNVSSAAFFFFFVWRSNPREGLSSASRSVGQSVDYSLNPPLDRKKRKWKESWKILLRAEFPLSIGCQCCSLCNEREESARGRVMSSRWSTYPPRETERARGRASFVPHHHRSRLPRLLPFAFPFVGLT